MSSSQKSLPWPPDQTSPCPSYSLWQPWSFSFITTIMSKSFMLVSGLFPSCLSPSQTASPTKAGSRPVSHTAVAHLWALQTTHVAGSVIFKRMLWSKHQERPNLQPCGWDRGEPGGQDIHEGTWPLLGGEKVKAWLCRSRKDREKVLVSRALQEVEATGALMIAKTWHGESFTLGLTTWEMGKNT